MPSGDDSDFGDLSDDSDGEYVPDSRSCLPNPVAEINDESSEDEDDDDSGSRGGTGSVDRGHWRKRLLDSALPTFSEAFTTPPTVSSPLTYFRMFVSPAMIRSVVEEANPYSTQTNGVSLNVTEAELEQFIGIYLMMGLVQMPSVRCYWENGSRFPLIADVMPRNRLEKSISDNSKATEDEKHDKLWKIQTWLNSLQQNILSVEPEEHNSGRNDDIIHWEVHCKTVHAS